MAEETPKPKRRVRYKGTHPRKFEEKYKEHQPEKYPADVEKVVKSGKTPAGTHRSVMVKEVLEAIAPEPGQTGLDATLGYGGHARELLERLSPGGRLFALDVDPLEITKTEARLREAGFGEDRLVVRRMNFAGIPKMLGEAGGGFDFIFADLGVSSMQLDNPARGFTFKYEGPLDLRLNPERGQPASALLKKLSAEELEKILWRNADERFGVALAKAIFEKRDKLTTTTALANVIRKTLAARPLPPEPDEVNKSIQKTFQALRIEVNDEFSALEQFLRNLPVCLKSGGRAVVLTFHSGEDKRVMNAFLEGMQTGIYAALSEEKIEPGPQECYDNPRAKSAVLRWAVKA
ncbi:MAG TPA: 16S rRNA (cytosine(1402)-N(4))-methyltransferase RsmH [Verrucomicrobiae bacterium]|jgi:16S rRNA (cytosine1402-N4)-methyltransferase|nr:16S rRNA (cytosine(1402)-N(4))-methyltransferase RsmH [Verrucomicrobiae bacterium]